MGDSSRKNSRLCYGATLVVVAVLFTGLTAACQENHQSSDAWTPEPRPPEEFDTGTPPPPDGLPYRFVRIDDLSDRSDSIDRYAGADIDAVVLEQAGIPHFATSVAHFLRGYPFDGELDPELALGSPDAFPEYPATQSCNLQDNVISLGGADGKLVVELETDIWPGDVLHILEVGNCDDGTSKRFGEEIAVYISVAGDGSRDWVALTLGTESPEHTFVIPDLPSQFPNQPTPEP